MARSLYSIHSRITRKYDQFVLAFFWMLGLCCGCFVFRNTDNGLISYIPMAVRVQPSLGGLAVPAILPFLFSAFAVYIGAPVLLYCVCFWKGFLLCYVSCAVLTAFPGGGWLIRWAFLFTDLFSSVLLYHYFLRHISGVRRFSVWSFAGYVALLSMVAGLDYRVISPLLRRVLS